MQKFDVGIIGAGPAGIFAALKIVLEHKEVKTILFDLSRPAGKRKPQCNGYFGCFPSGDGKLYINDIKKVSSITSDKKTKDAKKWFYDILSNIVSVNIDKDKKPSLSAERKIKKSGFSIELNDHIKLFPKEIHFLAKYTSSFLEDNKQITLSFDNEVIDISKQKHGFIISSQNGDIFCKRIIVCVGRSGWRWAKNLYEKLGIIDDNDIAKFGIRIETTDVNLKEFNKSNCTIFNEDLEIGPLCWNGTVIPEDHTDFAISAFRSNEERWETDKVSFNLIGNRYFPNQGSKQTERIGQLTFILANDRIVKERISTLFSGKSKISIMQEYNWLIDSITKISEFMPNILNKGYFHIPTILPLPPKINVRKNLSTDIDGMFVAGESAGKVGILSAITMGIIAGDNICK